jgi:NitT/TauT family transport system substrate-binding protein
VKIQPRAIQAAAIILSFLVSASSAQAKDLNYGWPGQGGWSTLPFIAATEKGLFDKEGLKVRMIAFRGTNVMLAASLAGEIDYASFLPFFVGAAARGVPVKIVGSITKSSSYAMISKPEVQSVAGLRGKRIGINSFGSSADFAAYMAVNSAGLDPGKDVTILPVGGGTQERLAALASGSVDATVLTSPQEYSAEKQGYKILVSMGEMAKLARIPITGTVVTQKKIDRDPDEIVRMLRGLRNALLLIQEQPEYGVGIFERVLRVDRASAKQYYGLFREQYNTDLSLPDAVVEDLLAVGTFRSKEKAKISVQTVRDWSFAEKAKR